MNPLFLSVFNETWIFLKDSPKTLKFRENPSRGNQVILCGHIKDRQTDITKLIFAFRNFVKATIKGTVI